MKKILYVLFLLTVFISAAHAQIDTIRLKDKRLNTSVLKPALNQYLVYFQMPKSPKTLRFWYWLRDVKSGSKNGEKVFIISQHWYGADTNAYRRAYSINKASDFAPVYFSETVRGKTGAYNWNNDKITGADSIAGNDKKGFALDFKEPNFNWNLDIETFEMLPFAAGKTFAINFYDAGLDPPKYYLYKVEGSEILATLNNEKVDCWKLSTAGDSPNGHYTQTFWISKKEHEFLKEEDAFNGGFRYKVKILGGATDLLPRFGVK